MIKIVINGDFYDHKITGVQRYAKEVIEELDNIYIENNSEVQIEVLVPEDCKNIPILQKIPVIKYGKYRKYIWLHYNLMKYCIKNKAYCFCMCTFVPFFYYHKSINIVHDAATIVHPEFYSKKYILANKILLWNKIKKLQKVFTVSDFSKTEIAKYCDIPKEGITVVYPAWEHIRKIKYNDSIFDKHPKLKKKEYCFSLSSLSPNKNFKWVIEIAKKNKKYNFAIAGMKIGISAEEIIENVPDNVLLLGYVSDEEMKSLMRDCILYLSPTLYEGFGVTPLEAISIGCKAVVSDIEIMHEVYEDSVLYINPKNYNYKVEELLKEAKEIRSDQVLNKYSWEKTARKIYSIFEKMDMR